MSEIDQTTDLETKAMAILKLAYWKCMDLICLGVIFKFLKLCHRVNFNRKELDI